VRPRALTQAELNDRLWPSTAVGYTRLASMATELRKTLGDETHKPSLLRTVLVFVYAFCGQAHGKKLLPVTRSGSVFLTIIQRLQINPVFTAFCSSEDRLGYFCPNREA
jgi:hypothetical protein